ncbi:MAG: DUF5781 family protein [Thaumarchaeota archaeon]|nr:DUF5781 family protein [Nitrososphaerota archaeon]
MSIGKSDQSLKQVLEWALQRMKNAGFDINSKVNITVDPNLSIMGYARQDGSVHEIVIADWALDSEMLGGLVLHELSHIYFTERGAPSHKHEIIEQALASLNEKDGLNERESEYMVEAFNHLQNILADDVVFSVMNEKEYKLAQRFFAGWVTDRPTGDPTSDAALLARNAFAIASLKRHSLYDERSEMASKNRVFLSMMSDDTPAKFDSLQNFYEEAKPGWGDQEFRRVVLGFFDEMLSLMRENQKLGDLR